jgi:molecular chaperone GrpE
VSAPSEKGNFSTEIGQDVIDEALRSVERAHAAPAEAPDSDPSAAAPPADATAGDADEGITLGVEAEPDAAGAELAEARKELEQLRAQLEFSQAKGREMMEKIKESHERALRAAADLDNFKKRAAKEKEEVQKFGAEKLLKDLLPVVDNLDRALEASTRTPDLASLEKGVAMTRKLFEDTLARHGVKGFSAKGQAFDPRLHEAMQQVPTADVPAGHVAFEVLRGYTLNERLVRPALVAVAIAPPEPAAAEPEPVADVPAPGSADPGNTSGGSQ